MLSPPSCEQQLFFHLLLNHSSVPPGLELRLIIITQSTTAEIEIIEPVTTKLGCLCFSIQFMVTAISLIVQIRMLAKVILFLMNEGAFNRLKH